MKKARPKASHEVEMRREYEVPWDTAVRGKYKRHAGRQTYFVAIDPDLKKVFPDADSINKALHVLASFMSQHRSKESRQRRSA